MGQAAPLSSGSDRLRVIICIAFDKRAPLERVKEFKAGIASCPNVLHSVEVSGTFDFMFEAAVPDLGWYHRKLEAITDPLQMLAVRVETNFVCARKVKPPPGDPERDEPRQVEFWVPCHDGRRRILASDITVITAERDYVRIHLNGSDCLFHCTIKEMLGRLDPEEFIHIHRSVIVRRNVVERLVHEKRHWKVRLADGSVWPVAKSHEREVMRIFSGIQRPSEDPPRGRAANTSAAASAANFMLLH